MSKIVVTTLIALALVGCTIGKDYRRPEVESPKAWRFEEKDAREISNTIWWEQFKDPALNDLIRTALRENKDILTASARVEEFLGRYGATRADLFPQAGAAPRRGGSGSRKRAIYRSTFRRPTIPSRVLSALPGRSTSGEVETCHRGGPRRPAQH